jgi:hypothetical protein
MKVQICPNLGLYNKAIRSSWLVANGVRTSVSEVAVSSPTHAPNFGGISKEESPGALGCLTVLVLLNQMVRLGFLQFICLNGVLTAPERTGHSFQGFLVGSWLSSVFITM